jgi:hypothetical protein
MFEKKLDTDPYLDRLEASDPALYEEIVLEFLKRPETKSAITRHEKTSTAVLRVIAKDNGAPLGSILSHPNCPPELIETSLKSGNDDDLISIAQNCSLGEETIRILAKSSYTPVLTWVSRRPDCPSDVLEELFSICEQQWQSAKSQRDAQPDHSSTIFDDDFLFGDDNYDVYFEIDEYLLEAIAANPNTPQEVFKKMMSMDLHAKWLSDGSLGATLMSNSSVSAEDMAFLSLQGFTKREDDISGSVSMIEHYGLPTSKAFEYAKFPAKYLEALNELGHPSGLLHPNLKNVDQEYDFNLFVNDWIKYETIYRTLWPELTQREDVFFWYWRSSYDGDHFYFSCKDVEIEQEFSRGSNSYNSMTYPFIDRPWVETDENMDIEMSHENFSNRDVEELFDYSDEGEQYDLILAAIVSKNSWSHEVESPQYSLTKKGEDFVCEWAESFFEDDRDVRVRVIPEKALPYSWTALPIEKKEKITEIIIDGFNGKVDTKYQFAEHFLTCIALHPGTPASVKELLKMVESKVVTQALSVS